MKCERKSIYYINSHGCKHTFLTRRENGITILKKRKFVYVLPEVVEIIDRVKKRCGKEINLKNVCLELHVHPTTIESIFKYFIRIGLLGKEEIVQQHDDNIDNEESDMEEFDSFKKIFPILRNIREEDYGQNDKQKIN